MTDRLTVLAVALYGVGILHAMSEQRWLVTSALMFCAAYAYAGWALGGYGEGPSGDRDDESASGDRSDD